MSYVSGMIRMDCKGFKQEPVFYGEKGNLTSEKHKARKIILRWFGRDGRLIDQIEFERD